MLLLFPTLLALILALLQGGSLRGLAALRLRGQACWILALALEVALYLPPLRASAVAARWGGALYLVALGLALWGGLLNWRLGMPARVAILGLALNATAIAANGGYMPVDMHALRASGNTAMARDVAHTRVYSNTRPADAATRLAFLDDHFALRPPIGPGNAYSVGDALLAIGVAGVVYRAARRGATATMHTRELARG